MGVRQLKDAYGSSRSCALGKAKHFAMNVVWVSFSAIIMNEVNLFFFFAALFFLRSFRLAAIGWGLGMELDCMLPWEFPTA